MRTTTLILLTAFVLLINGTTGLAKENVSESDGPDYGLGRIEDGVAYIYLSTYMSDDTPDIVEEIESRMELGYGRLTVGFGDLEGILPDWADGPVLLIGPDGRTVAEPTSAFVETDELGWHTYVGIEIELTDPSEILTEPASFEENRDWAVAIGSWSELEESIPESSDAPIFMGTAILASHADAHLDEYTDMFLEDFSGDPDRLQSLWIAEAGIYEGVGGEEIDSGSGYAVFYILSTQMEFAGAVEILDGKGDVRVEVMPWEGVGEFHGLYFEPLGTSDVDGDGWDELIVHIKLWELDKWEIWDPTPSGTEVLASWTLI